MKTIEPTELDELRKISDLIQTLTFEYGSKVLEIDNIKMHLTQLEEDKKQIHLTYISAQNSNLGLSDKLREKYGDVSIDLQTGQIS